MTAELERQPGDQNNLMMPAWNLTKKNNDPWPLSAANPSSGSEQIKVVVTARAMETTGFVKGDFQ